MAAPNLAELYRKLARHVKNVEDEAVLEVAGQILKHGVQEGKEDAYGEALHCKVVAALQTGTALQAALADIDSAPAQLRARLDIQRRYLLYRLGRMEDAAAGLNANSTAVEGRMLLAQIAYRRGDFLQALETYRALLPDVGDDGRNDIVANMLACAVSAASAAEAQGEPRAQAAGVVSGVLREAGVRGDESSEVAFNLACAALLQGDLAAAADKLEAARTLGLEALSEDGVEGAEADAELAHVASMRAVVAARGGQSSEALRDLTACQALPPTDPVTRVVVALNRAVLVHAQGSLRPKDALSQIDRAAGVPGPASLQVSPELEVRMSVSQKLALHCNRAALLAAAGRAAEARQLLGEVEARWPRHGLVCVARAVSLARQGQSEAALAALDDPRVDGSDAAVASLRASVASQARGRAARDRALAALREGPGRLQPATLARAWELCFREGRLDDLHAWLEEAQAHWDAQPGTGERDRVLAWLGMARAEVFAARGDVEAAAECARAGLSRSAPEGDRLKCARLLGAVAAFLPAVRAWALPLVEAAMEPVARAVEAEAARVPAAEVGALVAALRERGFRGGAKRGRGVDADGDAAMEGAGAGPAAKKRKKRKPRYPKGFDPANPGPPPDPERWLPKYMRKGFKHKFRKQAKKEAQRGAQGGGRANEALDLYNQPVEPKPALSKGPSLPRPKGKGGRK